LIVIPLPCEPGERREHPLRARTDWRRSGSGQVTRALFCGDSSGVRGTVAGAEIDIQNVRDRDGVHPARLPRIAFLDANARR
jgi:hypothetical protein